MALTDEQLTALVKRVDTLETKPKDSWDKASVLAAFLVPLAVVIAGNQYAQATKDAELESARIAQQTELKAQELRHKEQLESDERQATRAYALSEVNTRVGQAELVSKFLDALLSPDPRRQTLATQAILTALPDDRGLALVRVVSDTTPGPAGAFATDALQRRRPGLIEQLFADAPGERLAAYNTLLAGWRGDSAIVPELLGYARDHRANGDGVYNTLVFLSHMSRDALKPHVAAIAAFANEVRTIGPNIQRRADVLLKRLPA